MTPHTFTRIVALNTIFHMNDLPCVRVKDYATPSNSQCHELFIQSYGTLRNGTAYWSQDCSTVIEPDSENQRELQREVSISRLSEGRKFYQLWP